MKNKKDKITKLLGENGDGLTKFYMATNYFIGKSEVVSKNCLLTAREN